MAKTKQMSCGGIAQPELAPAWRRCSSYLFLMPGPKMVPFTNCYKQAEVARDKVCGWRREEKAF
jgi:hypothetical protein